MLENYSVEGEKKQKRGKKYKDIYKGECTCKDVWENIFLKMRENEKKKIFFFKKMRE